MPDFDDGQLLERWSVAKDERAFTVLVQRHLPMVRATAARLAGPEHVDDLVQATFIVFARKSHGIRKEASVAGWLHGVVRRLARNVRRLAARRREVALESAMEPVSDTAEAANRLAPLLDELLALLPKSERETLILFHLQNQPMTIIAERMGVPVGTVGSLASRGRERLRDMLARRGVSCSSLVLTSALSAFAASAHGAEPVIANTVAIAVGRETAGSQAIALSKPAVSRLTISVGAAAFIFAAAALLWAVRSTPIFPQDAPASAHGNPAKPKAIVPVRLRRHYLDEALSEINARVPLEQRFYWRIVVPEGFRISDGSPFFDGISLPAGQGLEETLEACARGTGLRLLRYRQGAVFAPTISDADRQTFLTQLATAKKSEDLPRWAPVATTDMQCLRAVALAGMDSHRPEIAKEIRRWGCRYPAYGPLGITQGGRGWRIQSLASVSPYWRDSHTGIGLGTWPYGRLRDGKFWIPNPDIYFPVFALLTGDREVVSQAAAHLDDPDEDCRAHATMLLGELQAVDYRIELEKRLVIDGACYAPAAIALGALGDRASLPAILRVLQSFDPTKAFPGQTDAETAIAVKSPFDFPPPSAAETQAVITAESLLNALADIGDSSAGPSLLDYADKASNHFTRWCAINAALHCHAIPPHQLPDIIMSALSAQRFDLVHNYDYEEILGRFLNGLDAPLLQESWPLLAPRIQEWVENNQGKTRAEKTSPEQFNDHTLFLAQIVGMSAPDPLPILLSMAALPQVEGNERSLILLQACRTRDPAAIPRLSTLANDGDSAIAKGARSALRNSFQPAAWQALADLARQNPQDLDMLEQAASLGTPDASPLILDLLDRATKDHEWKRFTALFPLVLRCRDHTLLESSISLAVKAGPVGQDALIAALFTMRGDIAPGLLTDWLAAMANDATSPGVIRGQAVRSIIKCMVFDYDDPGYRAQMTRLLDADSPFVRSWALRGLLAGGNSFPIAKMTGLLKSDTSPQVRMEVAIALGRSLDLIQDQQHAPLVETALTQAIDDAEPLVRATALTMRCYRLFSQVVDANEIAKRDELLGILRRTLEDAAHDSDPRVRLTVEDLQPLAITPHPDSPIHALVDLESIDAHEGATATQPTCPLRLLSLSIIQSSGAVSAGGISTGDSSIAETVKLSLHPDVECWGVSISGAPCDDFVVNQAQAFGAKLVDPVLIDTDEPIPLSNQ